MGNIVSKQAIDSVEKLNKEVSELTTTLIGLDKVLESIRSSSSKTSKDIIALEKAKVDSAKATKELATAEDKLAAARLKDTKATDIQKKAQERDAAVTLKATKEKERLAEKTRKAELAANKAGKEYRKQSATLNTLRNKAKDLALTLGEDSKEFRTAAKEVNKLDSRLKKIDKSLGQSQREVGEYSKAWSGVKSAFVGGVVALGLTAGVSKVKDVLVSSLKVFSEFGLGVSKLGAISRASATDQKSLEEQAKQLGATTQKTASSVNSLQIEYAKLGFKPKEILQATKATLNLSIATGENLADAAATAGSTIRAFGLNASETQRVTDVMAASFSSSALDLTKFQESMKLVAPISKAANIDLETTTALLGNLADSGLAGSIAGTGLKNVISKLSNENSALSKSLGFSVKSSSDLIKAFKILKERNVDLTEATELTDERSKAAFLTMINGIDSIEGLQKSLRNAEGSAQSMADTMADNLAGDTDKAKSAIEGLQISLGERLNKSVRSVTQGFTSFVGKIDEFISLKASEELAREQGALNNLVEATTSANTTQESRNRLIKELQKDYPDFLGNLNSETVTNAELRDRLVEVNAEYKKKIQLLVQQEVVAEAQKELVSLQIEELKLVKRLTGAQARLNDVRGKTVIIGDQVVNLELEARDIVERHTESLEKNRAAQDRRNNSLQNDLNILSELQGTEEDSIEITDNDTDALIKNTNELIKNTEAKRENSKAASDILQEIIKQEEAELARNLAELDILSQAEFKALEDEEVREQKLLEVKANSADEQLRIAEDLEKAKENVREEGLNNARSAVDSIASIEKDANAIQKAAYLVSRGFAVNQIIQHTAVANAKATAAFPLTGGLPWTAINTAAAVFSIGKILAQTVRDLSFADGVIDFQGKGSGTSDSNVVRISHGESVVKASATSSSKGLLTGINNGVITDDIIPTITGMRALNQQQQNITLETRNLENEMSQMRQLLSSQVIYLGKDKSGQDRFMSKGFKKFQA